MTDTILSAHKRPFKLKRHALKAIKGKDGYIVEKRSDGFVGVLEYPWKSYPDLLSTIIPAIEKYQDGIVTLKKEAREDVASKDLSGIDVICPFCGLSHHTTTKEYNPDINANPVMLDLKQPYKGWGWEELVKDASMGYANIICSECASPLAPDGKLRVVG